MGKRHVHSVEVRLFYMERALESLKEAQAYLLLAGSGDKSVAKAHRSVYNTHYGLKYRMEKTNGTL